MFDFQHYFIIFLIQNLHSFLENFLYFIANFNKFKVNNF